MKAFVTGAAGFIGSHLVEALLKRGYAVTALVRRTSDLRWLSALNMETVVADLSDIESCSDCLSGHDFVFHLAGLSRGTTERDFHAANTENTARLLRALTRKNSSLKRFVYLSSLAAVGPGSAGSPVNEASVPSPVSWYGRSKLAGEKAVLEYAEQFPVTILRPSAVYGPRDRDFLQLFRMIRKGFYPYWGESRYSMLYVDDLVRGIIAAAEDSRAAGETFFLAHEPAYTNNDLVREISSALGTHPVRLPVPRAGLGLLAFLVKRLGGLYSMGSDRINDFRHPFWTCDAGKARKILNFHPEVSLRQGIGLTADWYRLYQWL